MVWEMGKHFNRCDDQNYNLEYKADRQMEKESLITTPYFDCVFKQLSKLLICPYVFITKCFSLNSCYHLKKIDINLQLN